MPLVCAQKIENIPGRTWGRIPGVLSSCKRQVCNYKTQIIVFLLLVVAAGT
jgi:hypothetical protein